MHEQIVSSDPQARGRTVPRRYARAPWRADDRVRSRDEPGCRADRPTRPPAARPRCRPPDKPPDEGTRVFWKHAGGALQPSTGDAPGGSGVALRQTTRPVENRLRLVGIDRSGLDPHTLLRHRNTLAVNIPCRGYRDPVHLPIDSAGIEVAHEGAWHTANPPAPNGGCGARSVSGRTGKNRPRHARWQRLRTARRAWPADHDGNRQSARRQPLSRGPDPWKSFGRFPRRCRRGPFAGSRPPRGILGPGVHPARTDRAVRGGGGRADRHRNRRRR